MSAGAKVAAKLAQYGRPMLLRRRVGTTAAFTDVVVSGVSRGYSPHELVGGIAQGDRSVTISDAQIAAAGWPGPPRKLDVLVIDGTPCAVQGCESKRLAADVLAHVLWVRG